jgi:septal ring factor EnvC (AmiA/AmiB activator)
MQMDVPSKELGAATQLAQSYLSKIPGLGNSMPEKVSFVFKVTGTTSQPKVSLSKVLANGSSAKDIVNNAVEDLKKKAEEEAKAKAEELKKQAEQQARDAADRAKREAEQRAKDAAEKAKQEAEKKAKEIFKFPR